MENLKNTAIYRGGQKSSQELGFENKECTLDIDPTFKTSDFKFNLASKGGGTTSIRLEIGKNDWPIILKKIANETIVDSALFIECLQITNDKLLKKYEEETKGNRNNKNRIIAIIEELEVITNEIYQNEEGAYKLVEEFLLKLKKA